MDHPAEKITAKYKNTDLILIIKGLNREIDQFRSMSRSSSTYGERKEYADWAREFLFFLSSGVTPSSIGIEGLERFKEIILNLVAKEQLKKEVLNRFN